MERRKRRRKRRIENRGKSEIQFKRVNKYNVSTAFMDFSHFSANSALIQQPFQTGFLLFQSSTISSLCWCFTIRFSFLLLSIEQSIFFHFPLHLIIHSYLDTVLNSIYQSEWLECNKHFHSPWNPPCSSKLGSISKMTEFSLIRSTNTTTKSHDNSLFAMLLQ